MKNPDYEKLSPLQKRAQDALDQIYLLGMREIRIFRRIGRRIHRIVLPVGRLFLQLYQRTIGREVSRFWQECCHLFQNIRGGIRELREAGKEGKGAWLRKLFSGFPRAFRRHKNIGGACFRVLAPVVSFFILMATVSYWNSLDFSLTVECNGVTIQEIENEQIFSDACAMLSERMGAATSSHTDLSFIPSYTLGIRSDNAVSYDPAQVCDILLGTTDGVIEEAAGLYVNGTLVGSVKNSADLTYILSDLKTECEEENDALSSDFVQSIQVVSGLYPTENVMNSEDLAAYLKSEASPISVAYVHRETYTETIDYKTRTIEDDSQYTDYSHVEQKGVEGVRTIVDDVSYVQGQETGRTNVSTEVTKEPVEKIVVVGTKERPDGMTPGEASGILTWPTPNVRFISSYFEYRWGTMHNGIDIANGASYGQTIVAADGGTVEYVKLHSYGYGYHLCIDHGNGIKTLYAHCSQINVSAGQKVYKGQPIAKIGATGDVTGPHLHFEVRVYGSPVNPLQYVSP